MPSSKFLIIELLIKMHKITYMRLCIEKLSHRSKLHFYI